MCFYFLGALDIDAFQMYLKQQSPVTQEIEGRINIISGGDKLHSWSLIFLVIFEIFKQISSFM